MDVTGYDDQLAHPSWCWIDPGRSDVLFWQYFTGKAWEIASYIATAVLYTLIKLFLVKQVQSKLYKPESIEAVDVTVIPRFHGEL